MKSFSLNALFLSVALVVLNDQQDVRAKASRPGDQAPRLTCATVLCIRGSECKIINGKPKCICESVFCSQNYDPVCGTDGKNYPNECSLEVAACNQQSDIKLAHKGECAGENHHQVQPTEQEPQPNSEQDPCAIVRCGWGAKCQVVDGRAKCFCLKQQCPINIQGVCGSDGKTYATDCDLRAEACIRKTNVQVAHQGACRNSFDSSFASFL